MSGQLIKNGAGHHCCSSWRLLSTVLSSWAWVPKCFGPQTFAIDECIQVFGGTGMLFINWVQVDREMGSPTAWLLKPGFRTIFG